MDNQTFACCRSQHDITASLNLQNAKTQSHSAADMFGGQQPVRSPDQIWGETDDNQDRLVSFISLFLNADNSPVGNLTGKSADSNIWVNLQHNKKKKNSLWN